MPLDDIQTKIFTIRGVQVILDSDLAELFNVETKYMNQVVKRNANRFPEEFMLQLTPSEYDNLRLQFATSSWENIQPVRNESISKRGGRRYMPYVFTEQGVAMLSAVLRSETAVRMSIQIIKAFVAMRRFILTNAQVFQRLDSLELWKLETDKNMGKVLDAIESKEIQPKQGIFFNGQVFDAYKFVSDLFKSAKKSIVIIDNYLDDTVLIHLTKRKKNVKVTLLTRKISKALAQDVKKFNEQYPPIGIKEFKNAHDRFLIIDSKTVYHFGASLKDLGKNWFAFSKMDIKAADMLSKLDE